MIVPGNHALLPKVYRHFTRRRTARDSQCRLRNLRTEALGAPLSDQQCLRDERVLFLSDIFPTGLIERG